MWSVQQLEFAIKIAEMRSLRTPETVTKYKGKNETFEYSCTIWAWEMLEDYVKKHRYDKYDGFSVNASDILEGFMQLMDDWTATARTEQAKNAYIIAHDYADLLYDTMFETC